MNHIEYEKVNISFCFLFSVSCIAGSYYSTGSYKCEKCPKGTYTESAGLLGCPPCPRGTTTAVEGTSNSTLCISELEKFLAFDCKLDLFVVMTEEIMKALYINSVALPNKPGTRPSKIYKFFENKGKVGKLFLST